MAQARYTDPEVARFLTETLIRRRDMIGRHWYSRVNPLDRFRVSDAPDGGQRVTFVDRAVDSGFVPAASTTYRARLRHNDFGGRDEEVLPERDLAGAELPLSAEDLSRVDAAFFAVNGWISVGYFAATVAARWLTL